MITLTEEESEIIRTQTGSFAVALLVDAVGRPMSRGLSTWRCSQTGRVMFSAARQDAWAEQIPEELRDRAQAIYRSGLWNEVWGAIAALVLEALDGPAVDVEFVDETGLIHIPGQLPGQEALF